MATEEITTEARLEFPISLDSVLSVSLSYENLKLVLEYMMDILRKHEAGFRQMGNDQSSKELIESLEDKIKDNEKDIDKLKHKLKKVSKRAKKVKHYKKIPGKLKKLKHKVKENSEEIEKLQGKGGGSDLDEIRKQLQDHENQLGHHQILLHKAIQDVKDLDSQVEMLNVDPVTGLQIDKDTGYPRDPISCHYINEKTGYAIDPNTKQELDPDTGFPIDTQYNLPKDPTTDFYVDRMSKKPIDPNTKEYIPVTQNLQYDSEKQMYVNEDGFFVDQNTGRPYNPDTQQFIHPETGLEIDSEYHYPYNKDEGYHIDPITKRPMNPKKHRFIDPVTKQLTDERPSSSPIGRSYTPFPIIPAFGQGFAVADQSGSEAKDSHLHIELGRRVEELERRQSEFYNSHSTLQRKVDKNGSDISNLGQRVDSNETISKDNKRLIEQIQSLIKTIQENLSKVETTSEQNKDDIGMFRKLLKQFEDSLRQKVDADDFDALRSMLQSLGAGGSVSPQPVMATKDLNLLKDLQRKVEELENGLGGIGGEQLSDILIRVNKIEQTLQQKTNESDFQEAIDSLKQQIDRLNKMIKVLQESGGSGEAVSIEVQQGGVDLSKFNSLARRVGMLEELMQGLNVPADVDISIIWNKLNNHEELIQQLQERIEKLIKDIYTRLKELEDMINNKQEFLDLLKELEDRLYDYIAKQLSDFSKKFANKSDTKKALKYLERLIREYMDAVKQRREGNDAMFARKPLGGWSCASCEKNLEQLKGTKAPYSAWSKMPYRDPADRIARVGAGFSRMLATVQSEMLTNRPQHSYQNQTPVMEEDDGEVVTLPPIRAADKSGSINHSP